MKVTFLGTGTSVGVPTIGCECAVCLSSDPRNKRRRTSLYVEAGGLGVLVDTPPDFREQMLTFRVPRIDAVLFTHAHADHVFGFDDIRRYNWIQQSEIPAFAHPETLENIRRIFNYIGGEQDPDVYRPQIVFSPVLDTFQVGPISITPVPVAHGQMATQGYVFRHDGRSMGYIPDCRTIGDPEFARLSALDVMALDGLRHRPHPTHLTVADAVAYLQRIDARQSFLTHMCHDLDHAATEAELPPGIRLAYDGLALEW